MNYEIVNKLSDNNIQEINFLQKLCAAADRASYDYFVGEESDSTQQFVLTRNDKNQLCGYAYSYSGNTTEISGLVAPEYRKQHIFTTMLNILCDRTSLPVELLCRPDNPVCSICAEKLGYYKHTDEYMMQYFPEDNILFDSLYYEIEENANALTYYFYDDNDNVGAISVFEEKSAATIYDVLTHKEFRGRGYGKRMLLTLLSHLSVRKHIILLQVSGDNDIAFMLYKNIGFDIIDMCRYYEKE